MTRRAFWREVRTAAMFAALGIALALIGDPQPLAVIGAGGAGLTAAIIALRAVDARYSELRRQGRGGWEQ